MDHIYFRYLGISSLNLNYNTNLLHIQATHCKLASLDLSKQAKLISHYLSPQTIDRKVVIISDSLDTSSSAIINEFGIPVETNFNINSIIDNDRIFKKIINDNKAFLAKNILSNKRDISADLINPAYNDLKISYQYNVPYHPSAPINTNGNKEPMNITVSPTQSGVACLSSNFRDAKFLAVIKSSTYDKDQDGVLTREELDAVTSINVANKQISNLRGIEYFRNLLNLNCSQNNITKQEHLYLPYLSLKILNCHTNALKEFDFSNINRTFPLEELNCQSNQITKLGGKFSYLKKLYCGFNKLETIKGISAVLEILYCQENKIASLNVSSNNRLQELYCHDQTDKALTSLTLPSTKTALLKLRCSNNSLTTALSDIGSYTNLTLLWCAYNKIPLLDVSKNTKLVQLYTDNNQLTSLLLPQTTSLEEVNCYNNKIPELNATGCTKLWKFQCQNNYLRTLDLSKNATLTTLNCANQASIEDVSVFNYSKIGIYLPSGGKKDNFVDMQVAGAAQAADVLTNSGRQYLVVNPTPTGDVDLYGKTVTYNYNTECASPNFPNATMTGVTITTYPYVMWVNPNSKSVSGNYYSGTIVLDYDAVVPAGTEAYIITGLKATPRDMMYDGTKYSMQQFNMQRIAVAGQVVPKNTPVYVKSDTQDGLFAFGRNTTNATPVAVPSGNLLKGSATAAVSVDSYGALTLGREKKTGEVGFWQNKATSIPAHRCYLDASILNATNGAKGAVFCFEQEDEGYGEATSVDAVDNSQPTNDNWHSLDGRKLNGKPATKGIYIHNGRKEVVR